MTITGASSGIGRCTAALFSRHGWQVGLIARSGPGLDAVRRDLARTGGSAVAAVADVADAAALERAEQRFRRFGLPVLLLSWVPIIGDPITLVAGLLRVRLIPFLLVVTVAKGGRYVVLAAIVLGIVRW